MLCCDLFINLQPHARSIDRLEGRKADQTETSRVAPRQIRHRGFSSPLVAAGIEWFHPLLAEYLRKFRNATTLEIYRRSIAVIQTKSAGRALIHTNEKCGARTRGGAPVSG